MLPLGQRRGLNIHQLPGPALGVVPAGWNEDRADFDQIRDVVEGGFNWCH